MKRALLAILITASTLASAQQIGLSSHYMYNTFVLNPAFAGSYDYLPLTLAVRRQWVGINEAPVSQILSTHGYVGLNLGIGGYFFNETVGPTRRTGMNFSAAYHVLLNKSSRKKDASVISFGLSAVLQQFKIDTEQLTTREPDDQAIAGTIDSKLTPDANFGVLLKNGEKFYVGLSVFNLLENRTDLYNLSNENVNYLERTFYLMTGYHYAFNKIWAVQPTAVIRGIATGATQFDINAKVLWKEYLSMAVSYRYQDAVVIFAGIQNDMLRFVYSYDITTSELRDYNSGSHEVSLTAFFLRTNRLKGKSRYTRFATF